VVFGAPDELELKLRIQSLCPEVFFAHGESIRQTAALIGKCAAFVSNDSGLAHIAAAMDVPVVMLCGPTDPREVEPYGESGTAIHAGLGCSPCFRVGRQPMTCGHPTCQACMKEIPVERVLQALASHLRQGFADRVPDEMTSTVPEDVPTSARLVGTEERYRGPSSDLPTVRV
jgi:ADP-heptose:LPS heptosyltransferase